MEKTQLSISALVGAVFASTVFLVVDGKTTQVELAPDVPAAAVEVKGADGDTLLAEVANAEATGDIRCTTTTLYRPVSKDAAGEWVTEPFESCYCKAGDKAWSTSASECGKTVQIVDGKVYATAETKAIGEAIK